MLTYVLDRKSSKPLYRQLCDAVKADINNEVLHDGEKLPSKRELARNLGVSQLTVETAYAQLTAEGYITSRPRSGYYINALKTDLYPVAALEPEFTNEAQLYTDSKYEFDFTGHSLRSELFPFNIWAKTIRTLLTEESDALLRPCPPKGSIELRRAIVRHLREYRAMRVDPEQIVVGAGSQYILNLIIQLIGRSSSYAIEDPGTTGAAMICAAHGIEYTRVPLDDDGVDIKSLNESGADILHISPSHQFPTGIVTPISRRYELLSWTCRRDGRYIIEDDYDSELRAGEPLPTLRSIDAADRVIYMNTFTKTLAPTLRVAYMVLPRQLVRRFDEHMAFYSCTVSNLQQLTLARFIESGAFGTHINRLCHQYARQKAAVISAIADNPAFRDTAITGDGNGVHFILHTQSKASDAEIVEHARLNGVKIACVSQYCLNIKNAPRGALIIDYTGIKPEQTAEAIDALGKALV